ncbi:MAG: glucan biosynthesis protein D [Azospirillaceae bacterium]
MRDPHDPIARPSPRPAADAARVAGPSRRSILALAGLAGLAGFWPVPGRGAEPAGGTANSLPGWPRLGPARPYSFERLVERARRLAAEPHTPPPSPAPDALAGIDYDAYQAIRSNPGVPAGGESGQGPPIEPFHLHRYAPHPVGLFLVSGGQARRLAYDAGAFDYTGNLGPSDLPADLGWAGFRAAEREGPGDWLAFMGASYFRSSDPTGQYGLSARGIAIDTAAPGRDEEFPRFTDFWLGLDSEGRGEGRLVIDALLDGPSVTGAYRMVVARDETATPMDVTCRLFARTRIERLGIAPLTSMYWYSETNRHTATDWRPEIHDSDGLALWTGAGERLWRPLANPPAVSTSSFVDTDPRGFGLMQRDRSFANYEDDSVFYDRRPSAWVEPRGAWGAGSVMLVELPTDDEIHDNIVAFWTPARAIAAGDALSFDYRLTWTASVQVPDSLGRVVATRLGRAGVPGQPRPEDGVKIAVDFAGGRLDTLESTDPVEPMISVAGDAAGARIDNPYAIRVVGTPYWRVIFDVYGDAPVVDLRCFLKDPDGVLTETWLHQHRPIAW